MTGTIASLLLAIGSLAAAVLAGWSHPNSRRRRGLGRRDQRLVTVQHGKGR